VWSGVTPLARAATRGVGVLRRLARIPLDRFRSGRHRFSEAFSSHAEATASIPKETLAGYDNAEVAPVSFEVMCETTLWDYPVLFWLDRLLPSARKVLDAGGHQGTKYRAFGRFLKLAEVEWTVYDLPEIVRAGRERAARDGLRALKFVDDLSRLPSTDLLLGSGLLQYLDIPFPEFLSKLPALPRHVLVNKVAMWSNPSTFTLENFDVALVPYQIRNKDEFVESVRALGYRVADQWVIDALSNRIGTHPELGSWQSGGFYFERAG
jgi:putative methyltransferase (TIGR04325 family)